ncbi:cytochrome c [Sphingomicrobium sp. XHP0235]|uniref:c-type cytochrome n=1 Tax=Sphingomicrobium aquimarinum TaxID=3133971 RepID=UPI0031FECB1B
MKAITLLVVSLAIFVAACASTLDRDSTSSLSAAFVGAHAPDDAARLAHGRRVADVVGCTSCHGVDLQGGSYADDPEEGFIFAPNLTRTMPTLTDVEFTRLIREGIHPRRERLFYMPAKTLQRIAKSDLDALIFYLRSLEQEGREWPLPTGGETTDQLMDLGILDTSSSAVAEFSEKLPSYLGPSFELGRYVAGVTCAECHGPDLLSGGTYAPSFSKLNYSTAELERLLVEGVTRHGESHGLMALVVSRNLSALTPEERAAVIDYVRALGANE